MQSQMLMYRLCGLPAGLLQGKRGLLTALTGAGLCQLCILCFALACSCGAPKHILIFTVYHLPLMICVASPLQEQC